MNLVWGRLNENEMRILFYLKKQGADSDMALAIVQQNDIMAY